jgi:hypothetical protein
VLRTLPALVLLVANAVIWLAIGVTALIWPTELVELMGLVAASPLARLEVRAMYGGLSVGLAVLHVTAGFHRNLLRPALVSSGTLVAGLASGRVLSMALSREVEPLAIAFLSAEVFDVALIAAVLLWLGRGQTSP